MRIPAFNPPTKGDFPDIPETFFELLRPIVDQVDRLTKACQGHLDLEDNIRSEVRKLRLAHDTSTDIALQIVKRPIGVVLLWEELYDHRKITWEVADESLVRVKVYWDSTPATETEVLLWIIGS